MTDLNPWPRGHVNNPMPEYGTGRFSQRSNFEELAVEQDVEFDPARPGWKYGRKPHYVYVASSWRNGFQPIVIEMLKVAQIPAYDFRNPEGGTGFAWSDIDPHWEAWTAQTYIELLNHPTAQRGYASDMNAMRRADTFILVLPSGRSAHLETGWAAGKGKHTAIFTQDGQEPELMAKMCDYITDNTMDLLKWLGVQD